jgi:hypothetical protein
MTENIHILQKYQTQNTWHQLSQAICSGICFQEPK